MTWYVGTHGTNGPPCDGSAEKPWATIQYAANGATNWDTIHVLAGTYTESVVVQNKTLTIEGAGRDATVVQGAATRGTAAARVLDFLHSGEVTLRDLTIRHGCAPVTDATGGGIRAYDVSLVVSNCVVRDNVAASDGGGIYASNPGGVVEDFRIYGSTISGNECGGSGGGVHLYQRPCYLFGTTLSGNLSSNTGGGIFIYNAPTAAVENCTLYGNTAFGTNAYFGGGGINAYAGLTTIRNATIVSNAIPNGDGGGIRHYGNLDVESSIIAGNTAGAGADHSQGGSGNVTERRNLIGVANGTYFVAGWTNANGSYVGTADPRVLPLAANGGPTMTCALQADSPALNKGSNPLGLLYDQRGPGHPRVWGAQADIGAYEFAPPLGTLVLLR